MVGKEIGLPSQKPKKRVQKVFDSLVLLSNAQKERIKLLIVGHFCENEKKAKNWFSKLVSLSENVKRRQNVLRSLFLGKNGVMFRNRCRLIQKNSLNKEKRRRKNWFDLSKIKE